MKITAQEEYGLRCLLHLARAEDGQSLTIPEVAAAEGLSVPYVAKLLAVLRQAGIIDSVRGRSGGYRLAKGPAEIGLGQVLAALGEPLFDEPSYCDRHAGTEREGPCVHRGGCTLRSLWQTLEECMQLMLEKVTLADVLKHGHDLGDLLRARLMEALTEPLAEPPSLLTPLTLCKD
jgi:Rrf2 family protein